MDQSSQSKLPPHVRSQVDAIYTQYHRKEFLPSDPLEFVYDYQDPLDQEIAGLIAALLAYGNRKQIRQSVSRILRALDRSGGPAQFVRQRSFEKPEVQREFKNFYHRFNSGHDILLLFALISKSVTTYGSVGQHFMSYLKQTDPDIGSALSSLIECWLDWANRLPTRLKRQLNPSSSFKYLLTSPRSGSCCKRWLMFLRWMGRKDEIDPGVWMPFGLSSRYLVFPLDTHTGRIAKALCLTKRKSLNWKAALEVTEAFRTLDPIDPVRFDFSLCRTGMFARKSPRK